MGVATSLASPPGSSRSISPSPTDRQSRPSGPNWSPPALCVAFSFSMVITVRLDVSTHTIVGELPLVDGQRAIEIGVAQLQPCAVR